MSKQQTIDVLMNEQYRKDFKEYAIYTNKHRYVPEFRDGLKPVQRRIIYDAFFNVHAVTKVKSANIVGDTMGKYHPHGDSSIISALYNLINWFQTKEPLFNGQGNFGNTYENSPAAPRYTEAWLSDFTQDVFLSELKECPNVVDYIQTYDNKRLEPIFLPAKLPMLLINGCMAISVGNRIDIPTHNINDVIDETIKCIQDPYHKIFLIPDHCQQCEIFESDWGSICENGFGYYKVRGKLEVLPYTGDHKKYKNCMTIAIKSLPNNTFLEKIITKIESMVKENKIIGIIDIEEHSTTKQMNYLLILKEGTDPEFIKECLYKNTDIQQTFRVNMRVLDGIGNGNEPIITRMDYNQYIRAWIDARRRSKQRYYYNMLQKVSTKSHELQTYIWAIESGNSEKIIDIIRKQKNIDDNELIETLIKKCNITDIQAKFFINCELKKLSKGYFNNHKETKKELDKKASLYESIITQPGAIDNVIIQELIELKAKYGHPRSCKVIKNEKDNVPSGIFRIVFTKNNFVKKIGINDNPSIGLKDDSVKFVIDEDNSNSILLFDNTGRVFNLPIAKIPFSGNGGIDIRVLNKYINSEIISVISSKVISEFKDGIIVTLTTNGYIKKMNVADFLAVAPSGLVYCKVDNEDTVNSVMMFIGDANIIVYSNSKCIRIPVSEIPLLKRNSKGNIAMSNVDSIEGMTAIPNGVKDIIIATSKGYFNKVIPETITTGRNKRGSNCIKLSKGDSIVTLLGSTPNSSMVVYYSNDGVQNQLPISEIPDGSTISPGKKLAKNVIKAFLA